MNPVRLRLVRSLDRTHAIGPGCVNTQPPHPTQIDPPSSDGANAVLERNLRALVRVNAPAAQLIAKTPAREDVRWVASEEGVDVPELGSVALASRRRPLSEAKRTADAVDVREKATVLVAGFAAGYHIGELARRFNGAGLIIVYEPDVALLRAVLERVDHSAWLAVTPLVFITDPSDAAALSAALSGREAELALGMELLDHAPSRERLGDGLARLRPLVAACIDAVQITINTTLVQSITTLQNELSNLDRYTTCPGIADLAGAARGRPAIVVAAGPSLHRTLDALAQPGVADRFVIIAVQTALKTLLARGVRPHFVTALDYHEISRRFYEGLTSADVAGVTLVAEPKANRAILDAFPGTIRLCGTARLDNLLGDDLRRDMGELKPGATVAHMAYYLARHLGCDPVVLVGQDLGFTDGQYYAAGAAIHETWACELGPLRTLEMFEWERIKRMGGMLRRATDVTGRAIYTDVQMGAYLEHFQQDFAADAARGLTTLDGTGGGVRKQHADPVLLDEVIERELSRPAFSKIPSFAPPPSPAFNAVQARVDRVRRDVAKVGEHSRTAESILRSMVEHRADVKKVNRLVDDLNKVRDRVLALEPAFTLVNFINQAGSLRRLKADRAIRVEPGIDASERQRREIERDIDNVRWLADASDELGLLLGTDPGLARPRRDAAPEPTTPPVSAPGRVLALVPLLQRDAPAGLDRTRPFLAGRTALQLTVDRLSRVRGLAGAVILTDDPDAARAALGEPPALLRLDIEPWTPDAAWLASTRAARALAPACWRGGIAGSTIFDELVDPVTAGDALSARGADAALLVGPDWCFVDPGLCASLIERRAERPDAHTLVFTQAAPGLCGCVVALKLLRDLAAARASGVVGASIGGLLSYQPAAPMPDPIAAGTCVQVSPELRAPGLRIIPDTALRRQWLGSTLERLGHSGTELSAANLVDIIAPEADEQHARGPAELTIELCPGRLTSGRRAHWERGSVGAIERPAMSTGRALDLLDQFAALRPDGVVTLGGYGDPLQHPGVIDVARAAARLVHERRLRGVHLRTDLVCHESVVDALAESGVGIVSVDLMAETADTYVKLMGAPLFERARANVARLVGASRSAGAGYPRFWVVPRITRCDHNLDEIEDFYDRWTLLAGAAAIDALPITIPGERIAPLPVPASVRAAQLTSRLTVLSDGTVTVGEHDPRPGHGTANVFKNGLATAWRTVLNRRRTLARSALCGVRPSVTGVAAARPLVA